MPTLRNIGTYRFFFYANDENEPPHVHAERENHKAKVWLSPVRLANSGGFDRSEIRRILRLVEENAEDFLRGWNDYFAR